MEDQKHSKSFFYLVKKGSYSNNKYNIFYFSNLIIVDSFDQLQINISAITNLILNLLNHVSFLILF